MEIRRHHMAPTTHATGLIAPLLRATAHLGYCARTAEQAEDDTWSSTLPEILEDIKKTLEHFDHQSHPDAFVSQNVIDHFEQIKSELRTLEKAKTITRPMMLTAIQNMIHNIAWCAVDLEHDITGNDATEGSSL